jgi:hypothetical protein
MLWPALHWCLGGARAGYQQPARDDAAFELVHVHVTVTVTSVRCMVLQVKQQIQTEAVHRVRDAISLVDLAKAKDDTNMTEGGLSECRTILRDATQAAGFKAVDTPFPAPYRVNEIKKFTNEAVDSFGISAYDANGPHPGWHANSMLPTLRFMALREGLVCSFKSTKDVFFTNMCSDGANMSGAVNKQLFFCNLESFNKLKRKQHPRGRA